MHEFVTVKLQAIPCFKFEFCQWTLKYVGLLFVVVFLWGFLGGWSLMHISNSSSFSSFSSFYYNYHHHHHHHIYLFLYISCKELTGMST